MYLVGSSKIVDGVGSHESTDKLVQRAEKSGLTVFELFTATSEMRWSGELPVNYLRSACSPMQAIIMARKLFSSGEADVVVLRGDDNIRSKYADKKDLREKHFQIYGPGKSPLTEYNKVVAAFLEKHSLSKEIFLEVAAALFENYYKTWCALNSKASRPAERWFEFISEYFRGVDCANPSVDFSGALVFASDKSLKKLEVDSGSTLCVSGCSLFQVGADGPDSIPEIVEYKHLSNAFTGACEEAKMDFADLFLREKALLEVYTCYPVVPMALLLASGISQSVQEMIAILGKHAVTVTGGLNLSKAAWNCTTLGNIVSMAQRLLRESDIRVGGVHGNASLGYQQAFLILSKP